MAGKNDWQEEGIRLAGMLVDAVEIIHAALPYIRDRRHRKELEQFLTSSGRGPLPSGEALHALEGNGGQADGHGATPEVRGHYKEPLPRKMPRKQNAATGKLPCSQIESISRGFKS